MVRERQFSPTGVINIISGIGKVSENGQNPSRTRPSDTYIGNYIKCSLQTGSLTGHLSTKKNNAICIWWLNVQSGSCVSMS